MFKKFETQNMVQSDLENNLKNSIRILTKFKILFKNSIGNSKFTLKTGPARNSKIKIKSQILKILNKSLVRPGLITACQQKLE